MALSFLQRLFGQKKRDSDQHSLSITTPVKNVVRRDISGGPVTYHLKRHFEPAPAAENTKTSTNVNSLFAFVDPKDPFTPGEIAGEQLPGPILSIMSAKQFGHLFLFHTPHTREHAAATQKEVFSRYPDCQIVVHELPVSDPKDYSSVMGRLARTVRRLMKLGSSEIADCYVCVSSGTAEMRAAWFLLAALGVLPAKLLQVGSPARPLFGEANVKEVRMDSSDWQTILDLAMPVEYFGAEAMESLTRPGPPPMAVARGGRPWWVQRRGQKLDEKPKAGQEAFDFDKAFVDRMRTLYGNALPEFLFPRLSEKLRRNKVFTAMFSPGEVQDFARLVFANFASALGRMGGADHPERFGTLADSICNNVLVDFCSTSAQTRSTQHTEEQASEVTEKLPLTPKQGEALQRPKRPLQDGAAREAPAQLAKDGGHQAADELPAGPTEGPETAGEEEYEFFGGLPESKSRKHGDTGALVARRLVPSDWEIPGLDDALLELGIYVGSAALRHAAEQAGIAAGSHLPVLLLGETGTGKERFAHLIHRLSPRFRRPLVPVNCAAIPLSLAESYLLGHLKGAFTGATSDAKGIFEAADQGTLFLDEIAELTLEVQAKLLRVIQDGVVQRLGSTAPRKVDVRIVAASNRDLRKEVSAGRFREDLYFRLEVVQIKLPALRERRAEIPELALMLLRQINQRRQKPHQLTTSALAHLERQPWPGNVRDLLNVLERSVLYSRADVIDAEDLIITCDPPAKDPFAALPEPCDGFKVEEYLAQIRNQLFLRALQACKGNQTAAAERLGVSKQAVSKFVTAQNDKEN
jgi:transcriptional regulator with AAA-type ATPase domain